MTCANNILTENLKERHHLGNLDVDGRIKLKHIFNKNDVRTGLGKLTIDASEWTCEHGNELSVFIKPGNILST
jgi:hypothetical protein